MGRAPLFAQIVITATLLVLFTDTGGAGRSVGVVVHEAAAVQGCGRGCQTFSLQMIFTQHRRWNLDSQ